MKKLAALLIGLGAGFATYAQTTTEEQAMEIVDVRASYIGGYSALKEFVSKNVQAPTPETAGTVYVEFVVEADGSITKSKVARGMKDCEACNAEALRVVQQMPKWKPAISAGKNVASINYLPVRFEKQ